MRRWQKSDANEIQTRTAQLAITTTWGEKKSSCTLSNNIHLSCCLLPPLPSSLMVRVPWLRLIRTDGCITDGQYHNKNKFPLTGLAPPPPPPFRENGQKVMIGKKKKKKKKGGRVRVMRWYACFPGGYQMLFSSFKISVSILFVKMC